MTDIYIAGLGLQTVAQLTREVEVAIRSSREVLYLDTGVATRPLLQTLCPRVTSLYDVYSEQGGRVSAYEHMAALVVEAALDHPPVTFAVHGHPLVAVHPTFLVMDLARVLELRVAVLPGISAIDTVLADLRIDPVVNGIQMYEATDLLLRRRPLQPDVPAIIWQIGPLETCLHSQAVSLPERFSRFVGHLRQFIRHGMRWWPYTAPRTLSCLPKSCGLRWRIWANTHKASMPASACTCHPPPHGRSRTLNCSPNYTV